MFQRGTNDKFEEVIEGVHRKTLCHGNKTLMVEFRLRQGADLPRHDHPHEQTGYLISGKLQLTVGHKTFVAEPGDSWCIPEDIAHEARAQEDSVAVEVFSPVREDYLP